LFSIPPSGFRAPASTIFRLAEPSIFDAPPFSDAHDFFRLVEELGGLPYADTQGLIDRSAGRLGKKGAGSTVPFLARFPIRSRADFSCLFCT
jgi:hypothetical protein